MSLDQEQGLRILENALRRIVGHADCDYFDSTNRPDPCHCPHCVARAALETAQSWRFRGAHHSRTQHADQWPREVKMQAAWQKLLTTIGGGGPDHLLSSILSQQDRPTARDWYVATSVVQWLATNVGMTVLEAAGFKYQQWDQDRADGDLLRRRMEQEGNQRGRTEAKP